MKSYSPRIFGRRVKKVAKKLSVRRRHLRLNSNDQVRVRRMRKIILAILFKRHHHDTLLSKDEKEQLENAYRVAVIYYLYLVTYDDETHDKTPSKNRMISSYSDSQCVSKFRFQKQHLQELVPLLKLDKRCKLRNGIRMPGEEVLLRGLFEFANAQTNHAVSDEFGRDGSAQSRALTYFVDHMIDNFEHLVVNKDPTTDNLSWWFRNGLIDESADSIEIKAGVQLGNEEKVSTFIDCNCLPSCRVGGGPADDGANSARWNPSIQRAFYNSWKSVDGLKHQTVVVAHGFCVDMYGPTSLRRHDLTLFRESDINSRFRNLQLYKDIQNIILGDSAYVRLSHSRSYFKRGGEGHAIWNRKMKRVRISIEWDYGAVASLFPYLSNEKKLKILQCPKMVSRVYKLATILRNLHIGFYGCQSSNYFDIVIRDDFVKHYLTQTDFDA